MTAQFFIDFINVLEGAKTKCKNFHWAAPSDDIHARLDEFLDILSDYQDAIAEGYMGILGRMEPNCVHGNFPTPANALEFLNILGDKVELFYDKIPQNSTYVGVRGETESFIQQVYKYKYLFSLCDYKYDLNRINGGRN